MNNRFIYVPLGLGFLITIFLLANEVDHINLQPDRSRFILISIILSILLALMATLKIKPKLQELNIYQVFPMFLIIAALCSITYISLINRMFATQECVVRTVEVDSYLGRYASGYGLINDQKEASHYVLNFVENGIPGRIVSNEAIFSSNLITKEAQLRFCKGILGIEYVNVSL